MTEADPRWYESFFDDDWLVIALGHDDERTPEQVGAIFERWASRMSLSVIMPCTEPYSSTIKQLVALYCLNFSNT